MSPIHAATAMRTANVEATGVVIQPSLRWENHSRSPLWAQGAILAGLFALAIVLQFLNGAFGSEFNAYPDEPAHYVTSLMVREYITGPHPFSPLKFAEQYYHHYPKVAFGHWPPVFYVVQAAWMLLFSASRASVRLEIAFTTALLAFSLWREARHWFGQLWALLAAVLLVCVPLIQNSTDEEMAEITARPVLFLEHYLFQPLFGIRRGVRLGLVWRLLLACGADQRQRLASCSPSPHSSAAHPQVEILAQRLILVRHRSDRCPLFAVANGLPCTRRPEAGAEARNLPSTTRYRPSASSLDCLSPFSVRCSQSWLCSGSLCR